MSPETAHLAAGTLLWVSLDLEAFAPGDRLEALLDQLVDLGTEWVGFTNPGRPGWEAVIARTLEAGFQGLLASPLRGPLSPDQAAVLSRLAELRVPEAPDAEREANLEAILRAAQAQGRIPPAISRVPQAGPTPGEGTTRDCLDPWTGLRIGRDGVFPCAFDPTPVGRFPEAGLGAIRSGEALRARRRALLTGELPPPCRACRCTPWTRPGELAEKAAAAAARNPRPVPLPTLPELEDLFGQWARQGLKVLLYPAGGHALWLLMNVPALRPLLAGFGDRDPRKQALDLQGLPILPPEALAQAGADVVLVAAGEVEGEILRDLERMDLGKMQILRLGRLGRLSRRNRGGRGPA